MPECSLAGLSEQFLQFGARVLSVAQTVSFPARPKGASAWRSPTTSWICLWSPICSTGRLLQRTSMSFTRYKTPLFTARVRAHTTPPEHAEQLHGPWAGCLARGPRHTAEASLCGRGCVCALSWQVCLLSRSRCPQAQLRDDAALRARCAILTLLFTRCAAPGGGGGGVVLAVGDALEEAFLPASRSPFLQCTCAASRGCDAAPRQHRYVHVCMYACMHACMHVCMYE
jgi:hypothetical protein